MGELTIYQILCLLGVPAIIAGAFRYIHKSLKQNANDTNSVKLGLQALLRSQMISDYNYYSRIGHAPIYAKENYENVWRQYHNLGMNGVMDNLHEKFLALPEEDSKIDE